MITIGHASISEHGTVNGAKGDSTGKEVTTRPWYAKQWTHVLRADNKSARKKIAKAMLQACNNNKIGYGQSDRISAYNEYCKVGQIREIKTKCNCDCSSLVALCCIQAGYSKVSPHMWTGNEVEILTKYGFKAYTSDVYTKSCDRLIVGDILRSDTHTAIVVESTGAQSSNVVMDSDIVRARGIADHYDGNNKLTVGAFLTTAVLNLRDDASTKKSVLAVLPQGQLVNAYGYYSIDADGGLWNYVSTAIDGVTYIGFCANRYLARIN